MWHRISTKRLLIAMKSIHNLIIHQMDVKTAFLNGELEEEGYMNQYQGFIMFSMKDTGEADVILGIMIKHESNRIAISQSYYIEKGDWLPNCWKVTLMQARSATLKTIRFPVAALAAAGKEAEWLKNLLLEILLWSKPIASIFIHCDSAATLAKAYSQMYNGKS
ncbi:zinc finger, CCHC-type containing protein [Tanacetum coccineum]|uniref:Zinc finger, CCHC-type containing protein n=1 Tax=Tanacetum coccineum TaxID=301880 RepID=A0ABQ5AUL4_9ASTR